MILDVIVCALWCVGILGLVWCIAGWFLLPLSRRQWTVLFPDGRGGTLERQLRANAWLRAAGLERGMVYIVCDDFDDETRRAAELFSAQHSDFMPVTRAQLCVALRMERQDDEAGRTNDSRHGAERAVSEPGKRI